MVFFFLYILKNSNFSAVLISQNRSTQKFKCTHYYYVNPYYYHADGNNDDFSFSSLASQ